MKKGRIVVLGDRYVVNAFGMLGVEGFVVENVDDAEKQLRTLSKSGDIALIIVTKDVADMVQDVIDRISMSPGAPVITVIPSMWSDVKPIDAASLLKKALGVG
ncbi:MAG: V-type ATP synthase subunit F [Sulfolobales archaeon]